ncbi:MAG: DNA-directed RNA polymerase subunit alpha [Sulfurovum sp. PC08-66]|nr:MAG: DNA-directed RNA polymerase subunit alpha [Sulfurovum sp. PC08-66]KIM12587.1 MAG: DNA-directed RNA polymerase subunit alpha [Sulfuricurvum sp. PC08-66]
MKKIKTTPYIPQEFSVEKVSATEANIIAYPFETGFAVSLAHPLRRFLLSSSQGYAPIGIKIEGATHEFDSVRGMIEDVSEFIINLKSVRFKITNGQDEVVASFSFTGPKEITGAELVAEGIEVITPDAFLATLNEDATLNFSVIVHKGIGYVPSEDIRDDLADGYIALDAFFTPVRKATYTIENVLVEDNPNFEKVIINIVTDGQIKPLDAFNDALKVMQSQMAVFNSHMNVSTPQTVERLEETAELKKLTMKIDELGLSARSFNCLDRSGITYIGELVIMSENDLKNVKNLGKKSLEEITEKIAEYGFPMHETISDELASALKKKLEK